MHGIFYYHCASDKSRRSLLHVAFRWEYFQLCSLFCALRRGLPHYFSQTTSTPHHEYWCGHHPTHAYQLSAPAYQHSDLFIFDLFMVGMNLWYIALACWMESFNIEVALRVHGLAMLPLSTASLRIQRGHTNMHRYLLVRQLSYKYSFYVKT